ncbi:uncharacterized protein LOC129768630 isoform X2 [Toxorhynchites rutilus septentrionalis]|uniref:uncharacterized protein LOC129768630 isoform X2 n=1 Tax=Toxorhynchites rutilus septentrionalis TaxID=329112 RepID=UPI00247A6E1F|nr:uncharacterized protein LOC129768630 isoform X2 [Toxorhynchites rutilus septentrionalis]
MHKTKHSIGGKLKRKDPHPVRNEFTAISGTQFKCMYCSWTTCMNATRMVRHIVEQCPGAPDKTKEAIGDIQRASLEKERNSSLVSENKKDIHGWFTTVGNKRVCMFCGWATVRNLTRMRTHIGMQCQNVPSKVRSCFVKEDMDEAEEDSHMEEDVEQKVVETYQVVNLGDNRWDESGIQVVNSKDVNMQDDQLDLDEQDSEPNYLEVQEFEERICSWCGKALSYENFEVEDGNDVYCSNHCLKRQTKMKRYSVRSTDSMSNIQIESHKQTPSHNERDSLEPPAKQIKLLVVSNQASSHGSNQVVDYTPEHDCDTLTEEAPQLAEVPTQNEAKSATIIATEPLESSAPKKSTSTMVMEPRIQKKTAANEEGSCHSFAGGHVYPQEDVRSSDHKLQWTKAVISRPAPPFEATAVVQGAFKKIKLSDYRGKYLVFFFYPLDFTFVCPTEILAFSDRVKEFKKLNTEVIAASIDSHFTHLAWINTPRKEGGLGKINIPLVSDITHSIAKDYGVYLDDLGHTLRGLFIIDDRGILRQITMNDLPVGRSVDETLRLVQAFQYTDKHGEVCPAGWKPGQDTIVPNPEEKIKYFEKNH